MAAAANYHGSCLRAILAREGKGATWLARLMVTDNDGAVERQRIQIQKWIGRKDGGNDETGEGKPTGMDEQSASRVVVALQSAGVSVTLEDLELRDEGVEAALAIVDRALAELRALRVAIQSEAGRATR